MFIVYKSFAVGRCNWRECFHTKWF